MSSFRSAKVQAPHNTWGWEIELSARMFTAFVCTGFLLCVPSLARATTYWVSVSGSDSNSCAAVAGNADPGVYKATPASGEACLKAGDTLTIKKGRYTGPGARLRNFASGTAGKPTIIQGDPSSKVGCALTSTCPTVLNPTGTNANTWTQAKSHFIIRRIDFNHVGSSGTSRSTAGYPIRIAGPCTHVTLEDVEAHGVLASSNHGPSGIMIDSTCDHVTARRVHSHHNGNPVQRSHHGIYQQSDDFLMEDSWIHHNGNGGIQCYNSGTLSDGRADRCTIRNSTLENNQTFGAAIESNDGEFYNNIVRNNGSTGIIVGYTGSLRTKIYNNLVFSNGPTGVTLGAFGSASNSHVRNNIILGHPTEVQVNANSTGVIVSHNACGASDSCGTTGKLTISTLADVFVSDTDYRLKSNSPAIDAGVPSLPRRVCNGPCDIGPDEFASAPPPPAAPVCGQNGCESGETCENCAKDCGPCAVPREISAAGTVDSITADGQLSECSWSKAVWESFSNSARSDNTVQFATLWDADTLYLGFKVADAQLESDAIALWQNDGVEIYFDVLHTATASMDGDDWRIVVDIEANSTQSAVLAGVLSTSTGYTMELGIPWSALGETPEASKTLGLLVGNNDRDMGTSIQFDWNGLIESGSYNRPNLWGDLTLVPPPAEACDSTTSPPISVCAEVTACINSDGCCPQNCTGSDLDCTVTGTVSCTDDGKGGKICSVTDVTGCDATGGAPDLVLLAAMGILGLSIIRRR